VLVALAEGSRPVGLALQQVGADRAGLTVTLRTEVRSSGLDPEALASLGIDLDAVRERTDAVFGPGALDRVGRSPRHIPFTPDAKKALEQALREAIRVKQKTIDGRHLMLGMLRADSAARDALAAAGVDLDALRRTLEAHGTPGSSSA
jgi:ATP-dependent Clp protease ATP-binding subunit ClpA